MQHERVRVYGVDFSGASRAGRKIWIATGLVKGRKLRIEDCKRAEEVLGTGPERDRCLSALVDFVRMEKKGIFGFDFPFGLPQLLSKVKNWEDGIERFVGHYKTAREFYDATHQLMVGKEPKRITDVVHKTPFAPNNLRIYKQTYYGLCNLIAPLLETGSVCVLPMQKPKAGKAWMIEVCPASLLKLRYRDLSGPYKGRERRPERSRILGAIENRGGVSVRESLRSVIVGDSEGDALDAIIAAWATFNANIGPLRNDPHNLEAFRVEGYVYA